MTITDTNKSINQVSIIGTLGCAPEMKWNAEHQKETAIFTIATYSEYLDSSNQLVKETMWHTAVLFTKDALTYTLEMEKGETVKVEGRLSHRNYVDRSGQKRFITEIIASSVSKA